MKRRLGSMGGRLFGCAYGGNSLNGKRASRGVMQRRRLPLDLAKRFRIALAHSPIGGSGSSEQAVGGSAGGDGEKLVKAAAADAGRERCVATTATKLAE